jgi:hypothetical protein
MTTEQWVREGLGGYVRLPIEERREALMELAAEGMSQREIASVVGINHTTVGDDLRAIGGNPLRRQKTAYVEEDFDMDDGENPPPDDITEAAYGISDDVDKSNLARLHYL